MDRRGVGLRRGRYGAVYRVAGVGSQAGGWILVPEFIDYVARGIALKKHRDTNSWDFGDLLVEAVGEAVIQVGRPTDPEQPTLAALAREWDVRPQRASEWYLTAKCFPLNIRKPDISWSHHDAARRASEDSTSNALELLDVVERLKLGIEDFTLYLKGDYFHGYIERYELPQRLQSMLPNSARGAWITMGPDRTKD